MMHIPPVSAKVMNFSLFLFFSFFGFPPLTMMHLRIMLNTCWTPLQLSHHHHHADMHRWLSTRRCPMLSSQHSSSSFCPSLLGSVPNVMPCPIRLYRPAIPYEVFPSCLRPPFSRASAP